MWDTIHTHVQQGSNEFTKDQKKECPQKTDPPEHRGQPPHQNHEPESGSRIRTNQNQDPESDPTPFQRSSFYDGCHGKRLECGKHGDGSE